MAEEPLEAAGAPQRFPLSFRARSGRGAAGGAHRAGRVFLFVVFVCAETPPGFAALPFAPPLVQLKNIKHMKCISWDFSLPPAPLPQAGTSRRKRPVN